MEYRDSNFHLCVVSYNALFFEQNNGFGLGEGRRGLSMNVHKYPLRGRAYMSRFVSISILENSCQ